VFALATLSGTVLAITTEIPYGTLAILTSLFAGMLIISAIKEKLPGSSKGRFWPFAIGVTGYSVLLLLIEFLGPRG